MLIAQITDIHIGFEPNNPEEFNRKRLLQALERLVSITPRPDILLATGDITDLGDLDSYQWLKQAFDSLPFPVLPCMGNHDIRANFSTLFPDVPVSQGFVQYESEVGPLRLLILDTLEEGRHGGAFCEKRAGWLKEKLSEKADQPTVIIMHHPPVESGIDWMTTDSHEPWVARFKAVVQGQAQIVGILCGHLHRNVSVQWAGQTVSICASTAPQVALELAPIDSTMTDDRPMIVADPPVYALHYWNGRELVTHFDIVNDKLVLAKYDQKMQPLVKELLGERPQL